MNKRTLYNKNDLGKSFGLAVAAMLVGSVVLSFVFLPFANSDGSLPDWAFWTMQALYALAIGSTTFLYATFTKTDVLTATTIKCPPKLSHVGWGCLATLFLIALMLPINEFFMRLIVSAGLPEPSVDLPMQVVPMILVSCVLAAVTEELLFRGTIARSVANNKNQLAALAICGALFSLYHTNPAQTLHQFVLGAFLALLVFRSGSVWTTVLVHFFNNIVAVVLSFTPLEDAIFADYWYVFVPIGLAGFCACVFGYVKTTHSSWTYNEEEQCVVDVQSKLFLAAGIAVCAVLWIGSLVGWL